MLVPKILKKYQIRWLQETYVFSLLSFQKRKTLDLFQPHATDMRNLSLATFEEFDWSS